MRVYLVLGAFIIVLIARYVKRATTRRNIKNKLLAIGLREINMPNGTLSKGDDDE